MHSPALRNFLVKVFLGLLFCLMLGPFVWSFIISLQGSRELNGTFAVLIPRRIHWENYREVLRNSEWVHAFLTSLKLSLLSTVINCCTSVPFAFALARVRFPMKEGFRRIILVLIFMPMMFFFLPVRQMFTALNLRTSLWAVALPTAAQVYPALTLYRFYCQFPSELDEYTALQGLTPMQSFLRVYLPLSGKPILYAAMLQFISVWNCAFLPMAMFSEAGSPFTVQQALLRFAEAPDSMFVGMAAVILTCLPCWLLFISQFRFTKSVQVNIIDPFWD